jgi:hypothetical protein
MSKIEDKPDKKNAFSIILWWRINKEELDKQISGYNTIKFYKTARAQALGAVLFSVILALTFILFLDASVTSYYDISIFLFLGVFAYFGHRWALILLMLFWTFSKVYAIILQQGHPFVQVIWWAIFMHVFYFAFRVEQERVRLSKLAVIENQEL